MNVKNDNDQAYIIPLMCLTACTWSWKDKPAGRELKVKNNTN